MNHLPILFGYHASNLGNSHVPMSLAHHWESMGLSTRLYVPSADRGASWMSSSLGPLSKKIAYRLGPRSWPRSAVERHFCRRESNSRFVYLWAGLSLEVFRHFHQRGIPIIMERINCHQATAKERIFRFCEEWSINPNCGITEQSLDEENEKLALASAIFCPSPQVTMSLREQGVPEEKLIATSYGWSPQRFPHPSSPLSGPVSKTPRFLFVGSITPRKGVPLLLSAWHALNPKAELVLVGQMDPEIHEQYKNILDHSSIRHVPYTKDISTHYREADYFVFPSVEEGGPMVTYEAMAHGLLPIVSPMGAGAIVCDGKNGKVVPEFTVEAWKEAIQRCLGPRDHWRHLRIAAKRRAESFTWQRVAQKRAKLLKDRFPGLWQTNPETVSV